MVWSTFMQCSGCAWRKLENLEMHMERSHKPEVFKEVSAPKP